MGQISDLATGARHGAAREIGILRALCVCAIGNRKRFHTLNEGRLGRRSEGPESPTQTPEAG